MFLIFLVESTVILYLITCVIYVYCALLIEHMCCLLM
jgi:hypothetical protein